MQKVILLRSPDMNVNVCMCACFNRCENLKHVYELRERASRTEEHMQEGKQGPRGVAEM